MFTFMNHFPLESNMYGNLYGPHILMMEHNLAVRPCTVPGTKTVLLIIYFKVVQTDRRTQENPPKFTVDCSLLQVLHQGQRVRVRTTSSREESQKI